MKNKLILGVMAGILLLGSAASSVYATTTREQAEMNGLLAGVNGGLLLNAGASATTTQSQPTCDDSMRGSTWFARGGTGVADSYEVCSKNLLGTTAWRNLIAL